MSRVIGFNMQVKEQITKIRVLRIIARMNVGGPAVEVHNLMSKLNPSEFEQLLVTGKCEEDEIDYIDSLNLTLEHVRFEHLGRSLNLFKDIKVFLQIRQLMKEFRPDIVHTHTAKAGVLGRLASISLFQGHHRIHTYHGHLLAGYFSSVKRNLIVIVEKVLSKFTISLISVGKSVRDELISHGIGNLRNFKVIMPGLETDKFPIANLDRPQVNSAGEEFVICWIGRFTKIKRPDRLLDLARISKNNDTQVVFLAIGDGELRENLEEQSTEENLCIRFLGWRMDIVHILERCDAIILTSDNEGTPIVLMEAQLMGVIPIAVDVGSVSEVVCHEVTGFVEKYDESAFWGHIVDLKKNPDKKSKISKAAIDFGRVAFTVERFIQDHAELYRSVSRSQITNK